MGLCQGQRKAKWTKELTEKLRERTVALFSAHFNRTFPTFKEFCNYYKENAKEDRTRSIGKVWEEIADDLEIGKNQAYKHFINVILKETSEEWPEEIVDEVNHMIDEKSLEMEFSDFKMERSLLIEEIANQLQLKSMKQYHYESIYATMYNRITHIQNQCYTEREYTTQGERPAVEHQNEGDEQSPNTHEWIHTQLKNRNVNQTMLRKIEDDAEASENSDSGISNSQIPDDAEGLLLYECLQMSRLIMHTMERVNMEKLKSGPYFQELSGNINQMLDMLV